MKNNSFTVKSEPEKQKEINVSESQLPALQVEDQSEEILDSVSEAKHQKSKNQNGLDSNVA